MLAFLNGTMANGTQRFLSYAIGKGDVGKIKKVNEGSNKTDSYATIETAVNFEKLERLETTVDCLKRRFGNYCIVRACQLEDGELAHFNPHDEHIIHPIGFTV